MTEHVARLLRRRLGAACILAAGRRLDAEVVRVPAARVLDVLRALKTDPDTDLALLVDIFGVDRGAQSSPRFEVRYLLESPRLPYRAEIVVEPADADPTLRSAVSLFANADFFERELAEMYGIIAEDHPGLRPLFLAPGFVGYPGRKDYRLGKAQPLVPVLSPEERGIGEPIVVEEEALSGATNASASGAGGVR